MIEGGRRRLRPILMTAIATILALLPMALGLSKAGVFIAGPLAVVVIGGLTTSTILTLLLVPTLYVIVEDIRGRFGLRRITPPTPPASGKDLESRSTDEQVQEAQQQRTPSFVEEQAEPALLATPFVTEQTRIGSKSEQGAAWPDPGTPRPGSATTRSRSTDSSNAVVCCQWALSPDVE